MSLHDDLRKKLKPEDLQTIEDILGDDFDWDLVPRSRLNKVIKQRNELKKTAAGVTQTSEGSTSTNNSDNEGDEDSGAVFTQADINQLLNKEKQNAANAVKAVEIKYATLSKLREANALDPELVFGLLDSSKLSFNDKKELQGLEEAGLKSLQEQKKFLFNEDVPSGTGKSGSSTKKTDTIDDAIASVFANYGVSQKEE